MTTKGNFAFQDGGRLTAQNPTYCKYFKRFNDNQFNSLFLLWRPAILPRFRQSHAKIFGPLRYYRSFPGSVRSSPAINRASYRSDRESQKWDTAMTPATIITSIIIITTTKRRCCPLRRCCGPDYTGPRLNSHK